MTNYLIADIGSTTTKAFLFSEEGKLLASARNPTTVEKPYEDVKVGLHNTIKSLEKTSKIKILDSQGNIAPEIKVLLTSSAGGGLEMVVVGLTDIYSARIGKKAALGAGAIIKDVICGGDGRDIDDKIKLLGKISPDMILLVGGINSNNIANICIYAEYIRKSKIKNKYKNNPIPILYAGNEYARAEVKKILEDYPVFIDKNICENFKLPDTKSLQKKVIEIFYEHVMEDAPGYAPLKNIVATPILPTPIAVTKTLEIISENHKNILMFDIGGATTDIFALYNGKMFRSVSANIGMSFSIDNVLKTTGIENIKKYLSKHTSENETLNYIGNKKLNPTLLPESEKDLDIEKSVAINAIKIAINNHFELYKNDLEKKSQKFKRLKIYQKSFSLRQFLNSFDIVIGSGGIVSNNVNLHASKKIIENALERDDIEQIYIDKGFLFPHTGVLSNYKPEIAKTILYQYSLYDLSNQKNLKDLVKTNVVETKEAHKIKIIKKPKVTIKNYSRIRITKKPGDTILKNEVIGEKREKYYRVYAIPIPFSENQEFEWVNPKTKFKKGEKIAIVRIKDKGRHTIIAPLDGEVIEIKKYVILFRENSDIKEAKVSLNRSGESLRYTDKTINKFYPKGIIGQNFKQNHPIIYDSLNIYFVPSPISGKVINYDRNNQELTLRRIEHIERLSSFASGKITKVDGDKIEIKSIGRQIIGLQGHGESISGILGKEIIIIHNQKDLKRLYENDLLGGITNYMPYKDYVEFVQKCKSNDIKKSLIILSGYRDYRHSIILEELVNQFNNKEIYLSPFTRIRAGIERPFVYLE